jgi:hypothetical protein
MICPITTTKSWQDSVRRQGEAFAHLAFQTASLNLKPTKIFSERKSNLYEAIEEHVEAAPDYYLQAYANYGRRLLDKEPTTRDLIDLFYVRASSIGGTLEGDVLKSSEGNYLLFPEAEQDFKPLEGMDIPSKLWATLSSLSAKTGVPFQIINDPAQKFKGRYINQGEQRIVLINTAYANESTPLHEYYHPFVRLLKVRNPRMFDLILSKATPLATGENMDSEELVTEYLARIPKDSSILQRFLD